MKIRLLFIILGVAALTGCRKQRFPDGVTHWPPVSPYVDSLTDRVEMAIMYYQAGNSVTDPMDKLNSVEDSAHALSLEARKAVFTSRYLRRIQQTDSALMVIENIEVDSGRYPYEFNRIKTERLQCLHDKDIFTPEAYLDWLEVRKYYQTTGDTVMWAATDASLALFFMALQNPHKALEHNLHAAELYCKANHEGLASRLSLNLAKNYIVLKDTARHDEIHRRLIADRSIKELSPSVREIILRNTYITHRDTTFLNEALTIVHADTAMRPLWAVYDIFRSWECSKKGDYDAALQLVSQAIEQADRYGVENERQRALIYLNMSGLLEMQGDIEGAFNYLVRFMETDNKLRTTQASVEVQHIDTQRRIMENERESERRRARERIVWAFVLTGIAVAAAIVVTLLIRNAQRIKLRNMQVRLENERNNRHLAATALAMKEKDRLLDEMKQNISSMKSEGRIVEEAARELNNMINLHVMGKEEWEAFEVMLEKVSPGFTVGLKRIRPDMTMKYIRLASYIFVGLTNKQIAKLLMIRTESVHQARWRLRAQLGLSTGDSLEDFLLKLGSTP